MGRGRDRHAQTENARDCGLASFGERFLFSEWDVAETAMRKLKTLGERRKAAIALGPVLSHMDAMSRKRGVENGNDEELTQLRADQLFRIYLRGFEECCAWTTAEVWDRMVAKVDDE